MGNKLLTIATWLSAIEDREVREGALRNYKLGHRYRVSFNLKRVEGVVAASPKQDSITNALTSAFSWGNSKEGFRYWEEVYHKLHMEESRSVKYTADKAKVLARSNRSNVGATTKPNKASSRRKRIIDLYDV